MLYVLLSLQSQQLSFDLLSIWLRLIILETVLWLDLHINLKKLLFLSLFSLSSFFHFLPPFLSLSLLSPPFLPFFLSYFLKRYLASTLFSWYSRFFLKLLTYKGLSGCVCVWLWALFLKASCILIIILVWKRKIWTAIAFTMHRQCFICSYNLLKT